MEFPVVFVFGLEISKESNIILWNIQELSFVLSGNSRGKVKKIENSTRFIKKVYPVTPPPPVWIFSGIVSIFEI